MKQPPLFQHAPLKFTAKKCAAKKCLRRVTESGCGGPATDLNLLVLSFNFELIRADSKVTD
jgi:hypothetical protein